MNELASRKCVPCEGGVAPLTAAQAEEMIKTLNLAWRLNDTKTSMQREFRFESFFRTMSFVNAVAHVANIEDHHPDLQIGYNYCRIIYTTHAINGLSENDFICAAKIDRLAWA
jgi:4a-hydroxytetrahydrobiopterin dehydratase